MLIDAAPAQVLGDRRLRRDGQRDLGRQVHALIVAAHMKKMSSRKTQSIMGVMSTAASGSLACAVSSGVRSVSPFGFAARCQSVLGAAPASDSRRAPYPSGRRGCAEYCSSALLDDAGELVAEEEVEEHGGDGDDQARRRW